MPTESPKSETELIRRIALELLGSSAKNARPPFGDDMAALDPAGSDLLWTTDLLTEGVDFRSGEHSWRDIGWKALAVNLSDCAAMAVQPISALCAVSLNNKMSLEDALELARGVRDCGQRYGCPLVGGDTNSWDSPTVIACCVAGRAIPGWPPVQRDGARPGHGIFVTGRLGGSILGRHLRFEPRVQLGLEMNRALRPRAMIDISDGLARDLSRVLEASGCGARLERSLLEQVIHPDARELSRRDEIDPLDHALFDGEDFELIACIDPALAPRLAESLNLLRIGTCVAGGGMVLTDGAREIEIVPRGWEHFQ